MTTTREQVLAELATAGLKEEDFEDIGCQYWIDDIVDYRNTKLCGSVNVSTVYFIPFISKILAAVKVPSPAS